MTLGHRTSAFRLPTAADGLRPTQPTRVGPTARVSCRNTTGVNGPTSYLCSGHLEPYASPVGTARADQSTRWHDVLEQVDCLRGRPREVEALPGGLTNVNLKVTAGDVRVVVRVDQPGSDLLAIDREHEHRNSVAAAEAGVGAPVVDFLPDQGLLVVGFLDARPFTEEDLRDEDTLVRVAEVCRRLHAGPRFVNDFDMFAIQAGYLAVVREHGFRLPARYLEFAPSVERVRQAFAVRPEPTVPCNNDLLAG